MCTRMEKDKAKKKAFGVLYIQKYIRLFYCIWAGITSHLLAFTE